MEKKAISSESYDKIKMTLMAVIVLLPTIVYFILEAQTVFDILKGVIVIVIILICVIMYRRFIPNEPPVVTSNSRLDKTEEE